MSHTSKKNSHGKQSAEKCPNNLRAATFTVLEDARAIILETITTGDAVKRTVQQPQDRLCILNVLGEIFHNSCRILITLQRQFLGDDTWSPSWETVDKAFTDLQSEALYDFVATIGERIDGQIGNA